MKENNTQWPPALVACWYGRWLICTCLYTPWNIRLTLGSQCIEFNVITAYKFMQRGCTCLSCCKEGGGPPCSKDMSLVSVWWCPSVTLHMKSAVTLLLVFFLSYTVSVVGGPDLLGSFLFKSEITTHQFLNPPTKQELMKRICNA